jgi:hypothetical protein
MPSSCERDLDPGMSFTPAHNQADLASRFDHAPWETIRKENVLMWLSWICLDLPLHQARESEQHLRCLQETLEKLELEVGMIIPNGFDPKIKVHTPSLDPVIVSGRVGEYKTDSPKDQDSPTSPVRCNQRRQSLAQVRHVPRQRVEAGE